MPTVPISRDYSAEDSLRDTNSSIPSGLQQSGIDDKTKSDFILSDAVSKGAEGIPETTKILGGDRTKAIELNLGVAPSTAVNINKELSGESTQPTEIQSPTTNIDDLIWSVQQYQDTPVEQAKSAARIAKDLSGVHAIEVLDNYNAWSNYNESNKMLSTLTARDEQGNYKYPTLMNYIANDPSKARSVANEIDDAANWEALYTQHKGNIFKLTQYAGKEGGKSVLQGVLGTIQSIAENPELFMNLQHYPDLTKRREYAEQIKADIAPKISDFRKNIVMLDTPESLSNWRKYYSDVIANSPQMIASMGLSAAMGPVAGAAFMAQHIYGTDYAQHRDNAVDPERAMAASLLDSFAQTPLEYVSLGKITNLFKTTGGLKNVLKNTIDSLMTEMGTEFIQQFPQDFTKIYAEAKQYNQSPAQQVKFMMDNLPETIKNGIYSALVVAPFVLAGAAVAIPSNFKEGREIASKNRELYNSIAEKAKDSKLIKDNPDFFEGYINKLSDAHAAPKSIYVTPADLRTAIGNELDFDKVVKNLGIDTQVSQIEKDIKPDGKQTAIEIPMSRWTQEMAGTQAMQNVMENMRFTPEGLTAKETAVANESTSNDSVKTDIESMTKSELQDVLNINDEAAKTETVDTLKRKYYENIVDANNDAFTQYVNYLRKEGGNDLAINIVDNIKSANLDVVKGAYIYDPQKAMSDTIELAKGKADVKTIAHEISHRYSVRNLNYNAEIDAYENQPELNNELDIVKELYQKKGIFTGDTRDEVFSKLAEDFIESNISEGFLASIPKILKAIMLKIKNLFVEMSNSAKTFKQLVTEGKISQNTLDHLSNAVQGKMTTANVSEMINNNESVKTAGQRVDAVSNTLNNIRNKDNDISFQTSTIQDLLRQYIQSYNTLRKADNTFQHFNSTFYLDKTHELETEILGRIEEMTGIPAPINKSEQYDDYVIKASKYLNTIKSDRYATDKFIENLRNGNVNDLKYLKQGIELLQNDINNMNLVANYQNTAKRDVAQDEIADQMLQKKSIENNAENLRTAIKDLQHRILQEVTKVPKVGRDYALLKQIVNSNNKTALKNPERYLEQAKNFIDDQIDRVEARKNIELFDSRLNFAVKKRNTQAGQLKSITTPEYHQMLKEVKDIRKMSTEQAGDEIQSLIQRSEQENRELTAEETKRLLWLDTFNNLENKSPIEIKDSLQQLDSLIDTGRLKREIFEEEWKRKVTQINEKSQKTLLGKHEYGTQEERYKKEKADAKGWKGIKRNIDTLFNAQATFEMLMNVLSRNDILSPSMKSFLNTHFAETVHKATQNEETENRKRIYNLKTELSKIWNIDKGNTSRIFQAFTYQNKFKELEKTVDKTGVFIQVPVYKPEPITIKFDDAVKLLQDYAESKTTGIFADKFSKTENIEDIINHLKSFVYENLRQQVKYESDRAKSDEQYNKHRKLSVIADDATFNNLAETIDKGTLKLSDFVENNLNNSTKVYVMESRGKVEEMSMSQAEAIQYYLSSQQMDVWEKMTIHGWNSDNLAQLEKYMTDESKAIAKMLQDKYKKQYSPMNEVYKKLWWVDMPKITNYARSLYDVEKANVETAMDDVVAGSALYNSSFATAIPKSTIERVRHRQNLRKISALQVYTRSVAETSHFIHWAELAKELRGVFKNADTRRIIRQEFGSGRLRIVDNQIDMLINGGIRQNQFDHWANITRGYTSRIMQSGKVALIFTQLTGLVNYGAYISPVKLAVELPKFWKNGYKNIKALSQTNYIKNRFLGSGQSQEINMLIKQGQGRPTNYLKKLLDVGMIFTRSGDILTVMEGYWATRNIKYNEYIASGMNKIDAKKQAQLDAEMISDRTQSGGSLKDQGYLQSLGGTASLFQTFMSAQRVLLNIAHESIADAVAGKKGANAIRAAATTWIINGIVFQAAGDLLKNMFDDDNKFTPDWRDYLNAALIGPLNSIPFVASILTYTARKLTGQYTGGAPLVPGTEAIVENVINGIANPSTIPKNIQRTTGIGQTIKMVSGNFENKK